MLKRKFTIEVFQGEHSLDVHAVCSERIGSAWVWVADMPGFTLLPTTETEPKDVLKDALVALIEHL